MINIEESTKIAKDTKFSVLGRAIADGARAGQDVTRHIAEAELLRRQEQESADKNTRFAALARQIGDATRTGRDAGELVVKLMELRAIELGPAARS